tara:strand:- start:414 stop:668 length:255 start_codon:yes stop_codon:yes gene_type:complete
MSKLILETKETTEINCAYEIDESDLSDYAMRMIENYQFDNRTMIQTLEKVGKISYKFAEGTKELVSLKRLLPNGELVDIGEEHD